VVRDLLEHDYDVVATDIASSRKRDVEHGAVRADLTEYGQVLEVLKGVDAVIHLANIPAPGIYTPAVTFNTNMSMNFNVFHAAASCGLSRVVWASSETTLGLAFSNEEGPASIRAGRRTPLPSADDDVRTVEGRERDHRRTHCPVVGIPFVALRFSNIMDPEDYQARFLRCGWIPTHASGTCGATWMAETSPARAAFLSRRHQRRSPTVRA
jgi:nucleoside-diphosphate-sugar epimerase